MAMSKEAVDNLEEEVESGYDRRSLEDNINPMMNSVVLQTFFKLVSFEDLKVYRQVSKVWLDASLNRWRRDAWVKLSDNNLDNGSFTLDNYVDSLNGRASDGELLQLGKHPYRKFKLDCWDLKSAKGDEEDSQRQQEFWNKCGPQMTHLEIKNSTFKSSDAFESILLRCFPNLEVLHLTANKYLKDLKSNTKESTSSDLDLKTSMKNLKELKVILLGVSVIDGVTVETMIPISWLKFLGHFPNMKRLALGDPEGQFNTDYELGDVLTAMLTLEKNHGIEWKLSELDILSRQAMNLPVFANRHADLLRQLQFPLTTLSLDIGSETKFETFKIILKTYVSTLRKLVVFRADLNEEEAGYDEPFPFGVQLDSLLDLCLAGPGSQQTLNFLPFTPNLKRLAIVQDAGNSLLSARSYISDEETLKILYKVQKDGNIDQDPLMDPIAGTDFSTLEGLACSRLEEFVYSSMNAGICSPKEVAGLARLMPNLKTLMIGLGNDGFRVACQAWKELEVLIVQPYDIDETGLTGTIPMLNNRLPNLSDLSRLHYFGMGFDSTGRETHLSDDSVLNGILSLETLQDLTVVCSEKMSTSVFDGLTSKFPNAKIRTETNAEGEWSDDESDDEEGSVSWVTTRTSDDDDNEEESEGENASDGSNSSLF